MTFLPLSIQLTELNNGDIAITPTIMMCANTLWMLEQSSYWRETHSKGITAMHAFFVCNGNGICTYTAVFAPKNHAKDCWVAMIVCTSGGDR